MMGRKERSANPVDVQRRADRKKEVLKNRTQRTKIREATAGFREPEKLREQIQRYQHLKDSGQLDNTQLKHMLQLEKTLRLCLEQRAAQEEAAKSRKRVVIPGVTEGIDEEEDDVSENDDEDESGAAASVDSHGRPRKRARGVASSGLAPSGPRRPPQDSVYYDPVTNPLAEPPRGMPQRWHDGTTGGEVDLGESDDDDEEDEVEEHEYEGEDPEKEGSGDFNQQHVGSTEHSGHTAIDTTRHIQMPFPPPFPPPYVPPGMLPHPPAPPFMGYSHPNSMPLPPLLPTPTWNTGVPYTVPQLIPPPPPPQFLPPVAPVVINAHANVETSTTGGNDDIQAQSNTVEVTRRSTDTMDPSTFAPDQPPPVPPVVPNTSEAGMPTPPIPPMGLPTPPMSIPTPPMSMPQQQFPMPPSAPYPSGGPSDQETANMAAYQQYMMMQQMQLYWQAMMQQQQHMQMQQYAAQQQQQQQQQQEQLRAMQQDQQWQQQQQLLMRQQYMQQERQHQQHQNERTGQQSRPDHSRTTPSSNSSHHAHSAHAMPPSVPQSVMNHDVESKKRELTTSAHVEVPSKPVPEAVRAFVPANVRKASAAAGNKPKPSGNTSSTSEMINNSSGADVRHEERVAGSDSAVSVAVPAPPGVGLLRRSQNPAVQSNAVSNPSSTKSSSLIVAAADRVEAKAGTTEEARWLKSQGIKSASEDYEGFLKDIASLTR